MNINWTQAIIGVAGCAVIGGATYVTKNADCLWALILLAFIMPSTSNSSKSTKESERKDIED